MEALFPFFLVLFTAVFFSDLFRRLHLPWVIALIVGGILFGPSLFGILQVTPIIEFMGSIGLVFLMFMAGLEVSFKSFKEQWRPASQTAVMNGVIPFVLGVAVMRYFGFDWAAALLVGTVFISSSIAVIVPSLEANGIVETKTGKSIISSTIITDVASLVILSIILQTLNPTTLLPLPIFYLLLVLFLVLARFALPVFESFFARSVQNTEDIFQQEFRTIFVVLLGTVAVFELLGLHPIIAGFFAGLVLSDKISNERIIGKLRGISYGLFIPIFFVLVGMQTDISVFFQANGALLLTVVIILVSVTSKVFSGWLGAKMSGFTNKTSLLMGVTTIPQLSTSLAVIFTGFELGYLNEQLVAAMVMLSIITTFIAPLLIRYLVKKHPAIV